jgi:hypothetical protein
MDDREELFGQRRSSDAFILPIPLDDAVQLAFEKIQRQVFLGFKIVEKCPLGDPRFPGNGFGGGLVKTLLSE